MSTALQEHYFAFIRDEIDRLGVSPTAKEIADHFGVAQSTVTSIVTALIRQGRIKKTSARTRNLAIAGTVDLASVGTGALRAELARRGVTMEALQNPRAVALGRGRTCAAHGCQEQVRPGMLMCRRHWFQLPRPLRTAIVEAWSARQMEPYQEAVEAARDHLGGFTRVVERVE